jgi:hypothetical protein
VWGDLAFDHGAQFFSPSAPRFRELAASWVARGWAAEWRGRFAAYDAATGAVTPRGGLGAGSGGGAADGGAGRRPGFFNFLGDGPVLVGTPGMDGLARSLAASLGEGGVRQDARVSRICFDRYGKWLLEGCPRQMLIKEADRRALPSHTPWNLGVFDALVLADRLAATPGARARSGPRFAWRAAAASLPLSRCRRR